MQLFAKFKKTLRRGFRATLNFRKFNLKFIAICSLMTGQFVDTMILALTNKEWL